MIRKTIGMIGLLVILSYTAQAATGKYIGTDSVWSLWEITTEHNVNVINDATLTVDVNGEANMLRLGKSTNTGHLDVQHDVTLIDTITGFLVGYGGFGGSTVTQSAGTVTSPKLAVTSAAGNPSRYDLSGGVLTVSDLAIDQYSTLNLSGGSLSAEFDGANWEVSGDGTLDCSAGTISLVSTQVADKIYIENSLFSVSGGSLNLDAQVWIGRIVPSEFRVVGNDATISMEYLQQRTTTAPNGTFRFVFDEDGISPITVTGWANLEAASIVVDGSNFIGTAGTFTLFDMATLNTIADTNNISVTGFDDYDAAYVVQDMDTDLVQLVVEGGPVEEIVINSIAVDSSGDVNVEVSGLLTGKEYFLVRNTDLTSSNGFANVADSVTAGYSVETMTDTNAPVEKAFYRVQDQTNATAVFF